MALKAKDLLQDIEDASEREKKWRDQCDEIIARYEDDRDDDDNAYRLNILFANTELQKPALYSQKPQCIVRRRHYTDRPDPREEQFLTQTATALERCVMFMADLHGDFVDWGRDVVLDAQLTGRAVGRLRYVPVNVKRIEEVPLSVTQDATERVYRLPSGEEYIGEVRYDEERDLFIADTEDELLEFEEVRFSHVEWDCFRFGYARRWEDVPWVAFGAYYGKDKLVREFGKETADSIMEAAALRAKEEADQKGKKYETPDGCMIWELWHKDTRKQYFLAEGYDDIIEEHDDPLGLRDFFPIPKPLYLHTPTRCLKPLPEFLMYQDQADELDKLTQRMAILTDAIRAKGVAPEEFGQMLNNLAQSDDGIVIPVQNWMAVVDKGGLDGLISWFPVEQLAKVLQNLQGQRQAVIQQIFEITGLSDLVRGSTDPRETARAQQFKAQYGNRRMIPKQQSVSRFFRDLYALAAEIISEHFSPETISRISGIQMTADHMRLLRDDALRRFVVDIETDSTIAADNERERAEMAEFIQGMTGFFSSVAPLVQQAQVPPQLVTSFLKVVARRFRMGREFEDLLVAMENQPPPEPPPDPELVKMQAEMEQKQMEFQLKMQEAQQRAQIEREKAAAELQEKIAELEIQAREARQEREIEAREARAKIEAMQAETRQRIENMRRESEAKIENMRKEAEAKARARRIQIERDASGRVSGAREVDD